MLGTRSVWTLESEFWDGFFHSINKECLPYTEPSLGTLRESYAIETGVKFLPYIRGGCGQDGSVVEMLVAKWTSSRTGAGAGQEPAAAIPGGGSGQGRQWGRPWAGKCQAEQCLVRRLV